MKVIVITKIEHFPRQITLSEKCGSINISITGREYEIREHIIAVCNSLEDAREAIAEEKERILKTYGIDALDDESEEMHRYFTFGTQVWEIRGDEK